MRRYRLGPARRAANVAVKGLIRTGLVPKELHLLTTRGRRTGRLYSTPVNLVLDGDRRWLVAPYGVVSWVHNARAAERVTLTRRGRSEEVAVTELGPQDAAPVLKRYVENVAIVRPYFDARPDDPPEAFVGDVADHPVFRLG